MKIDAPFATASGDGTIGKSSRPPWWPSRSPGDEDWMAVATFGRCPGAGGPGSASDADLGASGDEPTPSEAAMLTETVEHLMESLEGRHREILTLSLQGYPPPEISNRLRCTERTVYRVLERVKQCLEAMQSGQGEG